MGWGSSIGTLATAARKIDPSTFKNLNPGAIRKLDVSSLGDIASKLPSDQIKRVTDSLNPQQLGDLVKRLDDIQIRRLTNNMDPGKLSDVLKNLDPTTLKRVTKNTDPTQLKNALDVMDPTTLKRVTDAMDPDVLKNVSGFDTVKKVDPADVRQFQKVFDDVPTNSKNIPKNAPLDAVLSDDTLGYLAKLLKMNPKELESALKALGRIIKGNPAALKAVGALGFLKKMGRNAGSFTAKNWLKIGGGVFLLCLMYNTKNPFTALDRATKDVGVTVRGLKDAAFDVGAGLGGLIELVSSIPQFLAANSGASFACCVCIILMMVVSAMR